MKRLFLLFTILFAISPLFVISAPNYDPNHVTTVYDNTYNVELSNRLNSEYDKKCWVELSKTHYSNICGTNSYAEMVAQKYIDLQKNDEELPHYQINIEQLHSQQQH